MKALDTSVRKTEESAEKMERSFEGVSKAIGGVTGKFAKFGLAVEGVQKALAPIQAVIENLNAAKGLKLTADRARVNTTRFQELAYAARTVGVDADGLADAMKDLSVKITDTALNGGMLEDALKAVGLNAKDLVNLSPDEMFLSFADAISKAGDNIGDFGLDEINDAMFQLAPLMRKGSDEFERLAKRAKELGIVLSEGELSDMAEAQKAAADLGAAWEGVFNQLTLVVTGPLQAMFDLATDTLSMLNKAIKLSNTKGLAKDIQSSQKTGARASGRVMVGETEELPTGEDFFSKMAREAEGLPALTEKEFMEAKAADAGAAPSESTGGFGDSQKRGGAGGFLKRFYGIADEDEIADEINNLSKVDEMVAEAQERARILMAEHEAEQIRIEDEAAKEKVRIAEQLAKDKLKIQGGMLKNMSSLMNTESRKLFEVGKAAAIAQATIATYEATQDSYKFGAKIGGPPLGAAFAATALAAGLNNVNNIKNTSFGSAGGGAASTGGAEGLGPAAQQEVVQTTNFDVTLQGDSFSGEQIRGLIGQINEATEDNVKLNAVMVS